MHFDPLLKAAHETGAEVIIQLRENCCDPHKGKIINLNPEDFTLFHSGTDGGMLWSFLKKDVAFCGLMVERPEDPEKSTDPLHNSTVNNAHRESNRRETAD